MKLKIEVKKSLKAKKQRYWSTIRSWNGKITYQTEMVATRQSALKTARNMARFINDDKVKCEVIDLAKTYKKNK